MRGSRGRADLRAPFLEAALETVQQLHHQDSGRRDDQDADEHLVGLEGGSGHGDEVADPGGGGVQLTYHDPEQGPTRRILEPREDEGDGAGDDDAPEDLELRGPEAPGHLEKALLGGLDPGRRVEEHRDHGSEEDHEDLEPAANPEPDDDDRQQRHARNRVQDVDEGAEAKNRDAGTTLRPAPGEWPRRPRADSR